MLRQFLFLSTVIFSLNAKADFDPPVVVPPPGPWYPQATALFDCPEGPGWLRITTIDIYGNQRYKQLYLGGGVKGCEAQADLLRKTRGVIQRPSVVALCSPKPSYMVRWVVQPTGEFTTTPQTYFGDTARCLDQAAKLNAQP